ncbi:DUF4190 domain-containing protein [Streptomyces sp. PT12]|uniref:DUF4190 domain-containing protein n=1 Tax=Streptomyces sp. PT12 TaxID=1510197 RepID=UPI000DE33363|nr:DUF4190 domain-containing protein [Streptomyces sp. PT12]RBM05621.1 DUF4190 domain-containing protein [Streptomyces sp. PT12]
MATHRGTRRGGTLTRRESGNLATGSLVCGIVGLFFAGLVLGVLAVVLGVLAHRRTPSAVAKAGIVLGAVDIFLSVVVVSTWMSGDGWYMSGSAPA